MASRILVGCIALVTSGLGLGLALVATGPARDVEHCAKRAPTFRGNTAYELIDVARKEVWATMEFSPQSFEELTLPISWVLWFKNDPRVPLATTAKLLRSPGCSEGEFTYMQAFGRSFVQVVHLDGMTVVGKSDAKIRWATLEKHHVLQYAAGQTVRLLQNPDGDRFVAVAETLARADRPALLPPGWTIKAHLLTDDWQVDLVGEVSVLRTENEDSFQGPVQVSF